MAVCTHLHSEFSALDGYSTVVEIADRIENLGLPGAFLTDHGTVAGHAAFAEAMTWKNKKKGIKRDLYFGFGIEAYQAHQSRAVTKIQPGDWRLNDSKALEKERAYKKGEDAFHLVLLAKNDDGLLNLRRLSDEAHRTGFYYDPRVDWELLKKYSDGVVATSACLGSLICQSLQRDDLGPLYKFHEIFGDDFYIELHTYDTEDARAMNMRLMEIAQERSIPVIYANDAHYTVPELHYVHEALLAAQYGNFMDAPKKHSNWVDEDGVERHHPPCLYIMGEDDVRAHLDYLPPSVLQEALDNTDALMEICQVKLPESRMHLPKFQVPGFQPTSDDEAAIEVERDQAAKLYLLDRVSAGLEEKYGENAPDEVWDRAEYEMRAIFESGLHDYFLIVQDYVNWAMRQGIMVGPGRGSAGGSILAHALDITNVDPIKYGLQFERFWNPGRAKGMPDIDIDFAKYGRDLVIEYVRNLYGSNRVAPIGNHMRMRPKMAIDKAGKVLYENPPYKLINATKAIIELTVDAGQQPPWDEMWETLGRWAEQKGEPHPLEIYREEAPDLFALAKMFEGRITTYGVHASGVVISDVDLPEWLPCRMATESSGDERSTKKKVVCTQAEMRQVDSEGFLKGDFLGLRNLDTIMYTAALSGKFGDPDTLCKAIDKLLQARNSSSIAVLPDEEREVLAGITRHYRAEVNYNHLPDSFWEQIDKGHTLGFFQIEDGTGARRIAKELKPRSIEDLAAIVALNRPGPLRDRDESGLTTVDRFLARRKGTMEVKYPHPILEPILEKTYGDFLYQEQVIAFFGAIGYDLGESDHIRKMLGKKLVEEMREEFPRYIERAMQFMPRAVAETIWNSIVDFSKYSFNKSHAVLYGLILAGTMYAKWKWPLEFVLASIMTNPKRVGDYIKEANRMGVKVLPPDVNRSRNVIARSGTDIIYGLRDIKGIGEGHARWIVSNAPYESPEDFYRQATEAKTINVGHIKKLMEAGAFDEFGYRLAECPRCSGEGDVSTMVPKKGGDGLKRARVRCDDCMGLKYVLANIPHVDEIVAAQSELLGIVLVNVNEDLIEQYKDKLEGLDTYEDLDVEIKSTVTVPGVITEVIKNKTGPNAWTPNADYANVIISWKGDDVKFVAWPEEYEAYKYMLRPRVLGKFTLVTGKKGPKLYKGHRFV